jgi:hypothetical protein
MVNSNGYNSYLRSSQVSFAIYKVVKESWDQGGILCLHALVCPVALA